MSTGDTMSTGDAILTCGNCGMNYYVVNGHICPDWAKQPQQFLKRSYTSIPDVTLHEQMQAKDARLATLAGQLAAAQELLVIEKARSMRYLSALFQVDNLYPNIPVVQKIVDEALVGAWNGTDEEAAAPTATEHADAD